MMGKVILLNVFLAFAPLAAHAQAAPTTSQMQCRDLAETYYIVGPDEDLVNGKVCKKVTAPALQIPVPEKQTQTSASAPTPSAAVPSDRLGSSVPSLTSMPTPAGMSAFAQQPCTKVVSFGYMAPTPQGARLIHYNIPDGTSKGWLNNWVRKNAKHYPDVCFLPNPLKHHANFLVALSDSPTSFRGFQAVTTTATDTTPVSGGGTFTNNYGGMWNFTYTGEVTTTTTTRENVPYEIHTNVLYANAYNDDGALVSHRYHVYSTQAGGNSSYAFGYNTGNAFRAINARGRLITSVVQDLAGPAQKKAKSK